MILLVDLCSDAFGLGYYEFVLPIKKIVMGSGVSEEEIKVVHYRSLVEEGGVEKLVGGVDKIILCGTPLMDNGFLEDDLFSWLKEVDVPVLGICAGMQVLGKLYGCEVVLQKEIGMIRVLDCVGEGSGVGDSGVGNPLFSGEIEVYALHQHGVLVSEGSELVVLGKNDVGVQAVRHKKKLQFGILFHPEVRQEEIVRRFLGLD